MCEILLPLIRYLSYMKTIRKRSVGYLLNRCVLLLPLFVWVNGIAQVANPNPATINPPLNSLVSQNNNGLFGSMGAFIRNIGQYKDTVAGFSRMGKILYGYEGLKMPVLFTQKGIIHLQRATKKITAQEKERLVKKGWKEKDIQRTYTINRIISMEWVNANANPVVVTEEEGADYFTYGFLKEKARTFRKIIYKELYPGIDLVYSFDAIKKTGFEYSLVARPGADISKVNFRYDGDVKKIELDVNGNLRISSGIDDISVSAAECFYSDNSNQKFRSAFSLNNNRIGFKLPENYNKQKTLVIDPFVSGTGGLSGTDAGKAKDIEFDYAGNIYIAGGGDATAQKLSKYNASGILQWTFNGSLSIPCWEFGSGHGGWVVDKASGDLYLGQGINDDGFSIIRLNAAGLYDNYITNPDRSFTQNWKMVWGCNAGAPKIYIAGGGGSGTGSTSNIELLSFSTSSQTFHGVNITGINTGNTDISDLLIDPASTELYTIFSTSVLDPREENKIYRHNTPYNHDHILWSNTTSLSALHEPVNRPYLTGIDNSSNTIAVNSGYLFYWDGKNLKAFKRSDGSLACSPYTVAANQLLMQGGIIADECNHVFVGSSNGTIKVFVYNGSSFDDAAAPDINIAGAASGAVYDLAYDPGKNLLYACGNGFVAAYDLSSYCNASTYSLNITGSCSSASVTALLSPTPPAGSAITYQLYDGTVLVSSNSSGQFSGLTPGKNYKILTLITGACSGSQVIKDFTADQAVSLKISSPAGVCSGNTFDLTAPSVTAGSSTGLSFTYWLDAAATVPHLNPAKTKPGTYHIKATSLNGCSVISSIEIKTLPSPAAQAGPDAVICPGETNITLKGSGGTGYLWTPATYLSDPAIANPAVNYPGNSGTLIYRLKVTDANGCGSQKEDEVKITFVSPISIFINADSAVAINQPLQLTITEPANSGFVDYRWSPTYGLNNPFIKNPVARLDHDMTYNVQATNSYKCISTASINIKVFRGPEIYVPNSFTPNGDGLNDVLKPIPVGLAEFHYLKIFNRFGQLLFTITDPSKGWDGRISGKETDYGTFIWIGEGIDYKGNLIMRKGATTVIR